MKIKYRKYSDPEWIRIPFSDLKEGEICRQIRHKYHKDTRDGSWYWDEYWQIIGDRLEPVDKLNKGRWSGYSLHEFIGGPYSDATVEVLR